MTLTLDTFGRVACNDPAKPCICHAARWEYLSPFVQGYIEAMFAALPQPDGHKPTEAMRRALKALAYDAEGKLSRADFFKAMKVTSRGRYLVYARMQDRHWIEEKAGGYICILPWGRAALCPLGFSDLALGALARIIQDCERERARKDGPPNSESAGQAFWIGRNTRTRGNEYHATGFPPLTPYLGDDGKVYLRETDARAEGGE